ncbi:MAG TPA: thiolase family protein [Hyphomicrobiales bacterium]|nr:thiolase family protein [Hyphomicrobiales bacterium]
MSRANALAGAASVVGIGHTDWPEDYGRVRRGEKPFDSYGYGAVALKRALDDAGLKAADVDGLIVGHMAYERAGELYGISPRWGGTGGAVEAVVQATMAIATGMAEVVALVYGNDQRSAKVQYGGPQAMGGEFALSYVYHAPWGLTSQGALYALMQRRYMELTGATSADLGQVAVAERAWAVGNPAAVMRKAITLEDYLGAEFIADPLRLYDYCMINDGGVALVIAEAGRAKRIAADRAVPIRAVGRADMNEDATSLKPRLIDFYRPGQKLCAEQVYAMAGLGPKDMDGVLIYDSFSCHVPFALEGFGFCGIGEAGRFIRETGIGPGGRLPVNSHGGHLSESYMQGWGHQLEAVRRLRGESAGPQYERCRHVQYVSDVGGNVFSLIYGREGA